jgi:tRNA G18 (ribose-2'-O)-methylase SpoU
VPLVLVLENIRSALNVGSLFRTADAFRLQEICLVGFTAGPDNREVRKTALGAENSVPFRAFESITTCLETLRQEGFVLWALEQTSNSVMLENAVLPPAPLALVLGNEVDGVSPTALALCDAALEIEQGGIKHSLNVAVAGGIAAWHLAQKHAIGRTH